MLVTGAAVVVMCFDEQGQATTFERRIEIASRAYRLLTISGGVSNLSFSFRGNNYIREAMHAVFLYHAIQNGMDFGIVNPSSRVSYEDIPKEQLDIIEDVILNRSSSASEHLIRLADSMMEAQKTSAQEGTAAMSNEAVHRTDISVEDRLIQALVKGVGDYLEANPIRVPSISLKGH